jgi:hypothetical protein
MGTTFLNLTNSVLRHFGEVELTSSTFASCVGFQAVAKDAVLDAIRVIQQTEYEWPFNQQISSFTLTASTATLGHTQLYALPTGTINVESVDWESFVLKRNTTLDPEVKERKLPFIDYDTWLRRFRSGDKNIDTDDTSIREPVYIFRDQTGSKIGVSPPPDRAYHIVYDWWGYETDLSAYTDTTTVPSRFDHVIRAGAFARCYQHREDIANYNISNKRFQEGIAKMRELLINQYKVLDDNRV